MWLVKGKGCHRCFLGCTCLGLTFLPMVEPGPRAPSSLLLYLPLFISSLPLSLHPLFPSPFFPFLPSFLSLFPPLSLSLLVPPTPGAQGLIRLKKLMTQNNPNCPNKSVTFMRTSVVKFVLGSSTKSHPLVKIHGKAGESQCL